MLNPNSESEILSRIAQLETSLSERLSRLEEQRVTIGKPPVVLKILTASAAIVFALSIACGDITVMTVLALAFSYTSITAWEEMPIRLGRTITKF